MAFLLRRTLLVNAVLYNGDCWYNLTNNDIKSIQSVDLNFYSRLFSTPKTTPKESYYLESGETDFETILKSRRLVYFHNLVNRDKSQLMYAFIHSQISDPIKGDWYLQVVKDMEDFNLSSDLYFYENISTKKFKDLIKKQSKIYSFNKYIEQKKMHSKMNKLSYEKLEIQQYLLQDDISIEDKKNVFRWRTHMARFGDNFRGGKDYISCLLCNSHSDSEMLAFSCGSIKKEINLIGSYDQVFEAKIDKNLVQTLSEITSMKMNYDDENNEN